MTAAREKIIEAMARGIAVLEDCRLRVDKCVPATCECRRDARAALAAIAEQGYAVVPRMPPPTADAMEYAAVIERDIARPDPAGEAKP